CGETRSPAIRTGSCSGTRPCGIRSADHSSKPGEPQSPTPRCS
ncbi:MAG: hypothetical protein AVDCRST_MAG01-01-3463, partial [uncultured Rubrobacteraceae bacterium]